MSRCRHHKKCSVYFSSLSLVRSLTHHFFAWIEFFTLKYRRSNESYRTVHVLDEHSTHETDTHFQNDELKLENTFWNDGKVMKNIRWKMKNEKLKNATRKNRSCSIFSLVGYFEFELWICAVWTLTHCVIGPAGMCCVCASVYFYVYINRCRWGFNVFPESVCDLKLLCFGCGKHR